MKNSRFTVVGVGLMAAVVAGCHKTEEGGQLREAEHGSGRPNIVFVLADDLGYGDLGCYGQKQIQTPHVDALAREGMKFTDAYAAPVCAPSRCTLLTGFSTGHCLVRGNAKVNLRPQDLTVEELLKQLGYYTWAAGKWGLGSAGSSGDPTHKGFDYFFGFVDQTHAHNSYPDFLYENETRVSLPNVVPHPGKYGQGVATVKKVFANDLFDQKITGFLDEQAASHQPFFLYAPFTAPHANDEAHENEVPDLAPYADKPWPLPEKQYAALVTQLDDYVGHLMAALHEHHLDRNTIVIFASDNGVQEEGKTKASFFDSSGPLRGVKRDVYDGGIRVPFIVWWPGHVAAGSTSHLPIAFYDFLPTAAELAGATPPSGIDGISFLPTLLGKPQRQRHEFLYWEFHEKGFHQGVRYEANGTSWKGVRHGLHQPLELYDLNTDIGEKHNVAAQHPAIVERIMAYLRDGARTESKEFPVTPKGS
ncbi:MAG: arylsulfatase [Phycisphaerae bacterium]